MARRERTVVDTVKDNIEREFSETTPRDWRDWVHWATDGWLEPFDRGSKGMPSWLLVFAAAAFFGFLLL